MNMNLNLKSIKLPTQISPRQLRQARRITTILVVLGLVGYTGYQVSQIISVPADQVYLQEQSQALEGIKLKVSAQTIQDLSQLKPAGDTAVPIQTGKEDPFSSN
jgi:hypothetical protein